MGTHTPESTSRGPGTVRVSTNPSRDISSSSSTQPTVNMSAYSHDNRVKYVVRYLYDIDNNGVLDKNDFKCHLLLHNQVEAIRGPYKGTMISSSRASSTASE